MSGVDKSKIVLMVQNASTLFCYYNISPITFKEFTDKYGDNALQDSKPVLKVYYVNNSIAEELQTIFIDPFADNWYINLNRSDIDVFVKLGRYLSDETFVTFATSNIVTTPRLAESKDTRVYYVNVSEEETSTKDNVEEIKNEEELNETCKKKLNSFPEIAIGMESFDNEFFNKQAEEIETKYKVFSSK